MRVLFLVSALSLCVCGGVQGQVPTAAENRSPIQPQGRPRPSQLRAVRVRSVTLEGISSISRSALRDSLVTQASGCRGLVLKPFCAISHINFFYEKHDLDRAEIPRDELRIRVIYFRNGFRETQVTSAVTPVGTDGEYVDVTFTVGEGPLTKIGSLVVEQSPEILGARQVRSARLPAENGPLDLNQLDSALIRLRNALWDRGHADAIVHDSTTVDPVTHLATVRVEVLPGPVATIGSVEVQGNETVSDYTVTRLLDLSVGGPYRRTDLTGGQKRLFDTEIFRQSVVRVPQTADSVKRVVVTVREAPPRSVKAGAGFNTLDFAQGELRFVRYNLFGGGRRLDTRAAIGNLLANQLNGKGIFTDVATTPLGNGNPDPRFLSPTWQVGLELTQPFFLSPKMTLGVGFSTNRRIIPDVVIDRGTAANVAVTRRIRDGFLASLVYRFEQVDIAAGDLYFCINFGVCDLPTILALSQPHRLSPVSLLVRLDRADDALEPSSGFEARLDAEHASAMTASDFQYQRIGAELSRYMRVGRSVLAGRVRGGWVRPLTGTTLTLDLPESERGILHPRRRFMAGGSRSVRGFAENQLGPRVLSIAPSDLIVPSESTGVAPCTTATIANGTCDPNTAPSDDFVSRPLGGNTLLEGSIEFRFPLSPTLTGAVFVDAGSLRGDRLNFPAGSRSAVTPGFGFRYRSPLGPVRIDLGIKRVIEEDLPVVTQQVGADGVPILVELPIKKHYDPLEGRGGFLAPILSRLQIHLAIGEAF